MSSTLKLQEEEKPRPPSLLRTSSFDKPWWPAGHRRNGSVVSPDHSSQSPRQTWHQRQQHSGGSSEHYNLRRVVSPRYSSTMSVTSNMDELDTIPDSYISTIISGFGPSADLYTDVLKVPHNATDRDIRIAYFKRGREVLAKDGHAQEKMHRAGLENHHHDDISNVSKMRFQAVSMAYEIINNPLWKNYYLRHGLTFVAYDDDDNQSGSSWDLQSVGAKSMPGSVSSRVRWSENVEELVFRKHPAEIPSHDDRVAGGGIRRNRKKHRKKPKIVVESKRLEDHLAKLDEEAEQHFVSDLLDDLEASFDGLLKKLESGSITGSLKETFKGIGGSRKKQNTEISNQSVGDDPARLSPTEEFEIVQSESLVDEDDDEGEGVEENEASPFDEGVDDELKRRNRIKQEEPSSPQRKETKPFDENDDDKGSSQDKEEGSQGSRPLNSNSDDPTPGESRAAGATSRNTATWGNIASTNSLKVMMYSATAGSSVEASLTPLPPRHRQVKSSGGMVSKFLSPPRMNNSTPPRIGQLAANDESQQPFGMVQAKQTSGKPGSQNPDCFVPIEDGGIDDDVFAGLEDDFKPQSSSAKNTIDYMDAFIAVPSGSRLRAESPGNLSDLSESVFDGPAGASSGNGTTRGFVRKFTMSENAPTARLHGESDNEISFYSSCSSKDVYHSFRDGNRSVVKVGSGDPDCERWCKTDSFADTFSFGNAPSFRAVKEENGPSSDDNDSTIRKTSSSSDSKDDFLKYLFTYVAALSSECSSLGSRVANIEWEETKEEMIKAFTIADEDMDSMLKILKREIGRTSSFVTCSTPVPSY